MVIDHKTILSEGPTENRFRPAINALFRSAALAYGPRAIGVLMGRDHMDGHEAFARLRGAARRRQSRVVDIATRYLDGDDLDGDVS